MQLSLWQAAEAPPAPPSRESVARSSWGPHPSTLPHAPDDLAARAEHYVQAAHAERTRKAYRHDWRAFEAWCARAGFEARPAAPTTLTDAALERADAGMVVGPRQALVAVGQADGDARAPNGAWSPAELGEMGEVERKPVPCGSGAQCAASRGRRRRTRAQGPRC